MNNKQQIENAICKWSRYLLENNLASEKELKNVLNEGLFKRVKTGIKNAVKHAGEKISSTAKKVTLAIHDTFAANKGVKELMDAVSGLLKKTKTGKKIKLWVHVNGKTHPVSKFELSSKRNTLALMFDENIQKPLSFEDLDEFLSAEGITGNDKRISDSIDAIICGQVEHASTVNESIKSSDVGRIGRVLTALGWNDKKSATKEKNINKILALFGIKPNDENISELKQLIIQHCNQLNASNDDSIDDDSSSNDDSSTNDTNSNTTANSSTNASQNTCMMNTKHGKVAVMDNPYKKTIVQNNAIAIVFGLSKDESEKRRRQKEAVKT